MATRLFSGIEDQYRKRFPAGRINTNQVLIVIVVLIAVMACVLTFYKYDYKGLQSRESIDTAQISANICRGQGFTTRFIRPCNMIYFKENSGSYPELNHGPIYPYLIATLFRFKGISEQVVLWLSLALFFLTLGAVYLLGRLLFDWKVAILALIIVGVSEPVLSVVISGEQWVLCTFVFTLLLIAIALFHRSHESRKIGIIFSAIGAALVGVLYLINPVLFFLIIPTAVYFGITGPNRRLNLIVFLIISAAVISPWAVRNYQHTGIPVLGATGWDIASGTDAYPGETLYRSVPDSGARSFLKFLVFPFEHIGSATDKAANGVGDLGGHMLAMLGLVATSFALVGMLYKFKCGPANALRGYLYGVIPLMGLVLALFGVGNACVIMLAPVISVFAAAYFLLLLDARKLHPFFKRVLTGALVVMTAFSTLVVLAERKETPMPYAEETITRLLVNQQFNELASRESIYTDIPWLVAWRTLGVGVWLPTSDSDYYSLRTVALVMNVFVLTPESDKLDTDEIWYKLHTVKAWRTYIMNSDKGTEEILSESGISVDKYPEAPKIIRRMVTKFKATDSVKGFKSVLQDPIMPDILQVFIKSEGQ